MEKELITTIENKLNAAVTYPGAPLELRVSMRYALLILKHLKNGLPEPSDAERRAFRDNELPLLEPNTLDREITIEEAQRLATLLADLLSDESWPSAIRDEIAYRLNDMEMFSSSAFAPDVDAAYIRRVLIAHCNGISEEDALEHSSSTLPQLLSEIMRHEDMNADLREDLWDVLNKYSNTDGYSAEWIAATLGMKTGTQARQARFSMIEQEMLDDQSPEANAVLKRIVKVSCANEDEPFIEDTIKLLRHLTQLDKLELENFVDEAIRYLYSWTKDFNRASDTYQARVFGTSEEEAKTEQAAA